MVNNPVRQTEPFGSQTLAICPLAWSHVELMLGRGQRLKLTEYDEGQLSLTNGDLSGALVFFRCIGEAK